MILKNAHSFLKASRIKWLIVVKEHFYVTIILIDNSFYENSCKSAFGKHVLNFYKNASNNTFYKLALSHKLYVFKNQHKKQA